ncbi:MAG TPA: hypothetical protein VLE19_10485, partial [Pyrinomonadaceae bacterium]|nr:hypothetical protein [Pyrinomonadaceae bacterium]
DLDRIAIDYLAVEFQCEFNSERAFAGRCWPDNSNHWAFRQGHARENITRKRITSQMSNRTTRPPTI